MINYSYPNGDESQTQEADTSEDGPGPLGSTQPETNNLLRLSE